MLMFQNTEYVDNDVDDDDVDDDEKGASGYVDDVDDDDIGDVDDDEEGGSAYFFLVRHSDSLKVYNA